MKKSIAGLGAVVVGFAGVIVSATPAQAATPQCATEDGTRILTADPAAGDFFMECVPQYGVAKDELVLESESEFPEDFNLSDDEFTSVASNDYDTAAAAYMERTVRGGFSDLFNSQVSEDLKSFSVDAEGAYKVASTKKLSNYKIPASCSEGNATYDAAYQYTFAPFSKTFLTTSAANLLLDGLPGKFVVNVKPEPVTVYLNFAGNLYDETAPQCAVTGTYTEFGATSDESQWNFAIDMAESPEPSIIIPVVKLQSQLNAADLVVSTKPATYGKSAAVDVSVKSGSAAATGSAAVELDGKSFKSFPLVKGKTTFVLPKTTTPGTHKVTVKYTGDKTTRGKNVSSTVKIGKGVTDSILKLKTTAKKKKTKLVASITVKGPDSTIVPTGKVAIVVNGKTVKTVSLKNGKAKYTLPVFKKKGKSTVVAKYLGSTLLAGDTSAKSKVRVK